ncbi:carboxylesterase [Thozetella sp. PMI_491]|nr:carboxylesterase [Thozetella sp. PMI_491]
MSLSLRSLLVLASTLLPTASAQGNWAVGQVVNTTSGPVCGHASQDAPAVSEYLGIPFAYPPIGDLRWAAPKAYAGTAVINASSFGNTCPKLPGSGRDLNATAIAFANVTTQGVNILQIQNGANDSFSEDCLSVCVWTKPQVGERKKAVVVFIHGGGFNSGSTAQPFETGAHFANDQDVVFVSFNYRLHIFGFPGHPDPEAVPYNLGIMDQRLAIEWVRENIAAFGGDTSRIVLTGSSAGGASVDYHAYAYPDDPIVKGFAPASGTSTSFGSLTPGVAGERWFNVSETLGCGDNTTAYDSVLACMRTKTTEELLQAIPPSQGIASILSSFGPVADDVLVFADYSTRTPAQLPLLIGSNDAESSLFEVNAALKGQTYPPALWTAVTQSYFTCPVGLRANRSLTAALPTWRYRFFGAYPNTELCWSPYSGAWHGAQNLVLMGNSQLSGVDATPGETALSEYMRAAYAAFARDPVNGLEDYGWPRYDPETESLVQLGYNNETAASFVLGHEFDGSC